MSTIFAIIIFFFIDFIIGIAALVGKIIDIFREKKK